MNNTFKYDPNTIYTTIGGINYNAAGDVIPKFVPASSSNPELAQRNNNPGNLRYIGQAGATAGEGGFARFKDPQAGLDAMINDLRAKQSGNTSTGLNGSSSLYQMISKYAPAADKNNPTAYADTVAKTLGVSTNTPIGQIDTRQLALAMAQVEAPNFAKQLQAGTATAYNGTVNVGATMGTSEVNNAIDKELQSLLNTSISFTDAQAKAQSLLAEKDLTTGTSYVADYLQNKATLLEQSANINQMYLGQMSNLIESNKKLLSNIDATKGLLDTTGVYTNYNEQGGNNPLAALNNIAINTIARDNAIYEATAKLNEQKTAIIDRIANNKFETFTALRNATNDYRNEMNKLRDDILSYEKENRANNQVVYQLQKQASSEAYQQEVFNKQLAEKTGDYALNLVNNVISSNNGMTEEQALNQAVSSIVSQNPSYNPEIIKAAYYNRKQASLNNQSSTNTSIQSTIDLLSKIPSDNTSITNPNNLTPAQQSSATQDNPLGL